MSFPTHVAIIPDGNRRWARARGLAPWQGHVHGAKISGELIKAANAFGIPYFTLWIASLDNLLKRPKDEVEFLGKIFVEYFTKLAAHPDIHKERVRVRAYGFLEKVFPHEVVTAVRKAEEATAAYTSRRLSFLMGYDGRTELTEAVKKIAVEASQKPIDQAAITADFVQKHLWTADLPPVDFVIRTGTDNQPHWSGGFLLWQTCYSQLYFTNTYFPDFTPEEFQKAIKDYEGRERRLGR